MNLKDIFKGHILKKMIFIIILRYARQANGGRLPPPGGGGCCSIEFTRIFTWKKVTLPYLEKV